MSKAVQVSKAVPVARVVRAAERVRVAKRAASESRQAGAGKPERIPALRLDAWIAAEVLRGAGAPSWCAELVR